MCAADFLAKHLNGAANTHTHTASLGALRARFSFTILMIITHDSQASCVNKHTHTRAHAHACTRSLRPAWNMFAVRGELSCLCPRDDRPSGGVGGPVSLMGAHTRCLRRFFLCWLLPVLVIEYVMLLIFSPIAGKCSRK